MKDGQSRGGRRTARQERSLTTVDAILHATELLLIRVGYDALSTTAIAEQAGVSVGSLYQYFGNREALVAALVDRFCARLEMSVAQMLEQPLPGLTPRECLGQFVETLVAAYLFDPALNRVLLECADTVGRADRVERFERRLTRALVGAGARARPGESPAQTEAAGLVLAKAMLSSLEAAVRQELPMLRDGTLVRELRDLAERWSEPRAQAPAPRSEDRLREACVRHLSPVLGPALTVRALESAGARSAPDPEGTLASLAPVLEVFLGISHTRRVLDAIRKELSR